MEEEECDHCGNGNYVTPGHAFVCEVCGCLNEAEDGSDPFDDEDDD